MALLVDDAHDLHRQTRRGLTQLLAKTRRRGTRLAVVLASHPQLKHALRRPALEEIGARAPVFALDGIKGQQRRSIPWRLEHGAAQIAPAEMVTPEALEL
jgi:type II secretory pathway predicted ATPase ExeA